ncbi:MAG TPA: winged helix-turn-helix domain-containing protein, partial [Deinococcales bacterium]|nr:winged helix-turn-helix domain-containing protein [Deinococcales bacterium]
GALSLDLDARRAFLGGVELGLTTLEFDLLAELAGNAGRVLSRAALIERVWGGDYPGVDRVVDVHVSSLRRKLAQAGGATSAALGGGAGGGEWIATIRGVGYRLEAA